MSLVSRGVVDIYGVGVVLVVGVVVNRRNAVHVVMGLPRGKGKGITGIQEYGNDVVMYYGILVMAMCMVGAVGIYGIYGIG